MKSFSIRQALGRGWELWKQNKMLLTLVTVLALILGGLPNPAEDLIGSISFELAFFIISTVVYIGWTRIFLSLEKGEEASFRDLFKPLHFFWRYFFASVLLALIVVLGLIALIIPGVYFVLKYQFVLILILDKDLSIKEAFRKSAALTEGVKWKLLGFGVVAVLVAMIGILALGVGILIAIPVIGLAHIHIYRKLAEEAPVPSQELPTN